MSFLKMIAQAKTKEYQNDADYFLPDVQGTMIVERIFEAGNDLKKSIVLAGTVLTCTAKKSGVQVHEPGAKVKKIYSISLLPDIHLPQLKTDILSIDGLSGGALSDKDVESLLTEIFKNQKSPMFELRGYKTEFSTKTIDRSAKGKKNLTGITFSHVDNDPKELAARAAEITARLGK